MVIYMHRLLLDTSVYGKLVADNDIVDILVKRKRNSRFVIYGSSLIRNELRATPRTLIHGTKKLRILLLNLYETFITKANHALEYNRLIETLSNDYFSEYRRHKGHSSQATLRNDFSIIATATIYKLDIVVSDDERTMLSNAALASYKAVNKKYGLPDPAFKTYNQFKAELIITR